MTIVVKRRENDSVFDNILPLNGREPKKEDYFRVKNPADQTAVKRHTFICDS